MKCHQCNEDVHEGEIYEKHYWCIHCLATLAINKVYEMETYTLEFLIATFDDHEIRAAKENEQRIREYKENYPDSPLPDHFNCDFSLPKALGYICKEIQKLKRKR